MCLCIYFRPVVFALDGDSLYEADFVLATLMDQNVSLSQISQGSQSVKNHTEQPQERYLQILHAPIFTKSQTGV